jgi:hypothetical protein
MKKIFYVLLSLFVILLSACSDKNDCARYSQPRPYDPEYDSWRQERAQAQQNGFAQQQQQYRQPPPPNVNHQQQQAPTQQAQSDAGIGVGGLVAGAVVGAVAGAAAHKLLTDKERANATTQRPQLGREYPSISRPAPTDLTKSAIAPQASVISPTKPLTPAPAPKPTAPVFKSYTTAINNAPVYKQPPKIQQYVPAKPSPKVSYSGSAYKSSPSKK